ncbi:MAG: branched-chain amino acid transaminase [Thermomicrobiales bacterium]|nr:branched-chain amino acid transaminase [Thermomicrobiales bacterium]
MAFSEQMEYAYFEGKIVPFTEAKISIGTHAVQYGTGAFGGIRGYLSSDGKAVNIVRLTDHTTRLLRSSKLLRMDLPFTPATMAEAIVELTRKNAPKTDSYYRPFVYKASVELTPRLQNLKDEFACYMLPMGDYLDTKRGMNMIVTSWTRTEDNMIPSRGKITGSYINASFAKDQAMAYGCDDAIMLNSRGKVAEGSAANLFIVRDGVLITAPINGDILEGITRRSVLALANDLGLAVEQREIDRSELYIADEVFFCGTGVQVAWVQTIDGRTIGNGERGAIAKQLYDALFSIFRGESADHSEWVTRVEIG